MLESRVRGSIRSLHDHVAQSRDSPGVRLGKIKVVDKTENKMVEMDLARFVWIQAENLAWEGGAIPSSADLQAAAKVAENWTPERDGHASIKGMEVFRRADRSKRKIALTLLGPAVAIGVTAIAGGPVTWALAGAAIAGAAVGIGLKKGWRNARYHYYQRQYAECFKQVDGEYQLKDDKAALNAVRFCLQKKQLSAISDDVKALFEAMQEYERRRKTGSDPKERAMTSCRDAVERVYWFHRVSDLTARLHQHFDLFGQLFRFVLQKLELGLLRSEHAMTDQNIEQALVAAHLWVNQPASAHAGKCKACCFAHGTNGRPQKPMVSTSSTLSDHARKPFVRLINDALYRSQHGESSAMARYTDQSELLKTIFKGTSIDALLDSTEPQPTRQIGTEGSVLWRRLEFVTPERLDPRRFSGGGLSRARAVKSSLPQTVIIPSDRRPPRDRFGHTGRARSNALVAEEEGVVATRSGTIEHDRQGGSRFGAGGGGALASAGLGVGGKAAMAAIAKENVGSTLAQGAVVSASTGGASVALALIQAGAEVLNLKNELQALKQELRKEKFTDLDMHRVMTALRTLLKDGGVFEKCVDHASKVIEYSKEFTAAQKKFEAGQFSCDAAYELAYRPLKAVKHIAELNKYLPLVSMYGTFADALCATADEYENEDSLHLIDDIKRWMDEGDHSRCVASHGKPDLCYAPVSDQASAD